MAGAAAQRLPSEPALHGGVASFHAVHDGRVELDHLRHGVPSAPNAPQTPTASLHWLEAVVDKAQSAGATTVLRVHLPGGAQLEVSQAAQVPLAAALLAALEKPALAC